MHLQLGTTTAMEHSLTFHNWFPTFRVIFNDAFLRLQTLWLHSTHWTWMVRSQHSKSSKFSLRQKLSANSEHSKLHEFNSSHSEYHFPMNFTTKPTLQLLMSRSKACFRLMTTATFSLTNHQYQQKASQSSR